jgi:dienelactone hydrolase
MLMAFRRLASTVLWLVGLIATAAGAGEGQFRDVSLIDVPPVDISLIDVRGEIAVEDRRQPYRLLAPSTGKGLPIVLFSHGAYSSNDLYDPILKPWAAAGFIVIAPTHADSVSMGTPRGGQNPKFFDWRLADMETLVQDLERILREAGLSDRAQTSRLAVTGHSFGGLVAQTLAGASYRDPHTGEPVYRRETRVAGAVIISGAGLLPGLVTAADLAALQMPLLITVGTDDLAQMPGLSGYAWRREVFDLAGSERRLLLVQDGADHYLGGQVGRQDLPRSPYAADYLQDFLRLSILHLRSWLRDDPAVQEQLSELLQADAALSLSRGRIERPHAKSNP